LSSVAKASTNERDKLLEFQTASPPSWILQHSAFADWLASPDIQNNPIWLSGTAGFGKSVLAAYLSKALKEKYPNTPIIYFFCKDKGGLNDVDQVIRTILYQLCGYSSAVRKRVKEVWAAEDSISDESASTQDFCQKLLLPAIQAFRSETTETILVLIDGLNELPKIDVDRILDLIMLLKDLGRQSDQPLIRILVTSRPTANINAKLNDAVRVLLTSKDNNDNIETFVRKRLNSNLAERFTVTKIDPVQYFRGRHRGMFLWVKEMLEYLATMVSDIDLKTILQNPPREINELYQKILARLYVDLEPELPWVKKIISWILVSKRDLTVAEIEGAVIFSRETDSATAHLGGVYIEATLSKCGAILQVVDSGGSGNSKTVSLVHDTFKEFIKTRGPEHWLNINVQSTHSQVALLCLRCLSGRHDKLKAFNDYAKHFWIDHLSQAERSGEMATRLLSDLFCFFKSDRLKLWIKGYLLTYSVSGISQYEFEEPSWSYIVEWLNGLGVDENKDENLSASLRWRRSVLSTNIFWEDIGKAAVSVWLSDDLEEFAYVAAAFRLALKYFRRTASRGDPHDLFTDLFGDQFRPMAKWADVPTYDERNIGIAYASLRMPRDAINCYLQSSNKNKESPILWEYVGHMYHAIGEIEEEIKAYKKATEKDPKRFQPFAYLACAYKSNGEMQNAEDCCSKAIKLKPEIESRLRQYLDNQSDRSVSRAQEETPDEKIIWINDFISFVTQPPWNLQVA
jgi:tetratricopeptide (TPR) repeat protein